MPSGNGSVPVIGVMAFGRLVARAVADVAVSPVTVLGSGATMIVVGKYGAESVMVAVGSKLLPKVSETVVMLGNEAEEVVATTIVVGVSVVTELTVLNEEVDSVAGTVMLAGIVTVVGRLVFDTLDSGTVVFTGTVEPVADKIEVLSAVRVALPKAPVGKSVIVVLALNGNSVLVVPSVPITRVLFAITVVLGEGVGMLMPVPGPVAEALMV